ncbi:MAG: hypothetical protein H6865_00715 [Rhodospirillales bacterium]|nr:hypothetical protein [Alphaproteobacteria bacterium]MCB9986149.1 hypothetical protein [Rhodospirillales bacterium]USO07293.1 MAG: hypothetical protein H6866_07660 [Rhodospirillales bacterium]
MAYITTTRPPLERLLARILDSTIGVPLRFFGRGVMAAGTQVSVPARIARALRGKAASPDFSATLMSVPGALWLESGHGNLLRALDDRLAEHDIDAQIDINRAALHRYLTQNDLWSVVLPKAKPDARNDELAQRLFAGYRGLLRAGDGTNLRERTRADYTLFMRGKNLSFERGYALAIERLIQAAHHDMSLYAGWPVARIGTFCAPLIGDLRMTSRLERRELRYIHPGLLARHVAQEMRKSAMPSSLPQRLLAALPPRREYGTVVLGIFDGTTRALAAGAKLAKPSQTDSSHDVAGKARAALLNLMQAPNPWGALGAAIAKGNEPLARMIGSTDAANTAQALSPAAQTAFLNGVQARLTKAIAGSPDKATQTAIVRRGLEALGPAITFRDAASGNTINLDAVAARKDEEKLDTCAIRAVLFSKLPLRSLVTDTFNALAVAPALETTENTAHAHAHMMAAHIADYCEAHRTMMCAQMISDFTLNAGNGNSHDAQALLAIYAGLAAGKADGAALEFGALRPDMARELKSLLSDDDPWAALGRRMVTLQGDARDKHPLSALLRPELAGATAGFLPAHARNALYGGMLEGMRTVLRAKKRNATAHVGACLKAIEGHAAMYDTRDGKLVTGTFGDVVAQTETQSAQRLAAGRSASAAKRRDIGRALSEGRAEVVLLAA